MTKGAKKKFNDRLIQSKNKIIEKLKDNEINNIYFLILYELPYIFCDGKVLAGFINQPSENDVSTSIDLNQHKYSLKRQPLNTLHLTERVIKNDHFEKILKKLKSSSEISLRQFKDGYYKIDKLSVDGKNLLDYLGITAEEKKLYNTKLVYIFVKTLPNKFKLFTIFNHRDRLDKNTLANMFNNFYKEFLSPLEKYFDEKDETQLPSPSYMQIKGKKRKLKETLSTVSLDEDLYTRDYLDESIDNLNKSIITWINRNAIGDFDGSKEEGMRSIFLRTIRPDVNYFNMLLTESMCKAIFKAVKENFSYMTNDFFHEYKCYCKELKKNKIKVGKWHDFIDDGEIIDSFIRLFELKDIMGEKVKNEMEKEKNAIYNYIKGKRKTLPKFEQNDKGYLKLALIANAFIETTPLVAGVAYTVGKRGIPYFCVGWQQGHPFLKTLSGSERQLRYPTFIENFLDKKVLKSDKYNIMVDIPVISNGTLLGVFITFPKVQNNDKSTKNFTDNIDRYLSDLTALIDTHRPDLIRSFFLDICTNMTRILAGVTKEKAQESLIVSKEQAIITAAENLLKKAHEIPRTYIFDASDSKYKEQIRKKLKDIFLNKNGNGEVNKLITELIDIRESENTVFNFFKNDNGATIKLPILKQSTTKGKQVVENVYSDSYFASYKLLIIEDWKFIVLQLHNKPERNFSQRERNNSSYLCQAIETGLITLKKKYEIIKHGTKAAVAAIMSRNMSHNIGSHVLSYWGNKLRKSVDALDDQNKFSSASITNICTALSRHEIGKIASDIGKISDVQKKQNNINNQVFRPSESLFDYLKKRMDFIAEITTTVPAWETTLSLKNDLIEIFQRQFAILDNIARSEGFCYAPCFENKDTEIREILNNYQCKKVDSGWKNCKKETVICERLPDENDVSDSEPQPMQIKYEGNDYPVSIPHGVVGKQAFFSILENFIRNSAKHGGEKVKNNIKNCKVKKALIFTVKAEEAKGGDYIEVTLSDNIGNCADVIDKDGSRVIDHLKKAVDDKKYTGSDGRIKKGSWGIKEMKVSANFLRKREVDVLVEGKKDSDDLPLIKLTCFDDKRCTIKECSQGESAANISMTFFLRKPKEVFIVKENDNLLEDNKKWGIETCTINEFKEKIKDNETIPHRFLLFKTNDKDSIALAMNNREILPSRIIVNANSSGKDSSNKERWIEPVFTHINNFNKIQGSPVEFILELYEEFLKDKLINIPLVFMRKIEEAWKVNGICDVGTEDLPSETSELIIFDNHHDKMVVNNYQITGPASKYYQGVSGGTSFGIFLKNQQSNEVDKKLNLRGLAEASMVKVLIADERIWRNSQGKVTIKEGKTVWRLDLLEKMGIFLIPVSDSTISKEERKKIVGDSYQDVTFFVIHQGLIDKMKGDNLKKTSKNTAAKNDSGTQFIKDVVNKFPYVIIDSGRGEPEELEPGTRYIPMSAIENFVDEMDKYSLIQTLFSVRRATRGNNKK